MTSSTVAPTTSGPSTGSTILAGGSLGSAPPPLPKLPIDHVFIIFKENHTYDNYFATFPGGNGATTAKNSKGQTVPLSQYVTTIDLPGPNTWAPAHADFNGGAMDQFDVGEKQGFFYTVVNVLMKGPFVTYAPPNGVPGGPIQYYWQIAQQGALCDNYFTSVMGQSIPNHMYSVAATSGGRISNTDITKGTCQVVDVSGNIHDHSPHFTAGEIPTTLPNELEKKGLTWTYLDEMGPNTGLNQILNLLENNNDGTLNCMDVASSLPDFNQRYSQPADLRQSLAGLLAAGQAGNVTWIKPMSQMCEHPMISEVPIGVDWTRQIVNAIGQSQYWGHCAIFITFDDFGGFYDHVPPPQVDVMGLGFRVPCMIVSPYAKKGFIDHTQYEHSSMLKFAERLFDIKPMTTRDAASADMTDAFDFNQTPRDFSEFHF
jgi:phospholipase C